jgi:3-hydroxyisobutyrate dehydrogenase
MTTVAVIGLGRMGGAMAARLVDTGQKVVVWNRTPQRSQALAEHGAEVAESPGAAARDADLVLVCVADPDAQRDVLFGDGGVLAGGAVKGVLVSTSTVAPADVVELARHTPAVLDVGLLGNHQHAREGKLRLYVGGQESTVDQIRPLLEPLAQQVLHAGPLGSGMQLKLLMNLLMGVQVQAMAEAVALGVSGGLDRRTVLDAITVSGFATPVMGFKAKRLGSGNFADPDFRLRLMAKDLGLAVAQGRQDGLRLPLTAAAQQTHAAGVERGYGDEDCAAVARMVGIGHGGAE